MTLPNSVPVICAVCSSEFSLEQIRGVNHCPECKTTIPPYSSGSVVSPALHLQELRVLTHWAAKWAEAEVIKDSPESVVAFDNTVEKLRKQFPGVTFTMGDEIKLLRQHYKNLDVKNQKGEDVDPL